MKSKNKGQASDSTNASYFHHFFYFLRKFLCHAISNNNYFWKKGFFKCNEERLNVVRRL